MVILRSNDILHVRALYFETDQSSEKSNLLPRHNGQERFRRIIARNHIGADIFPKLKQSFSRRIGPRKRKLALAVWASRKSSCVSHTHTPHLLSCTVHRAVVIQLHIHIHAASHPSRQLRRSLLASICPFKPFISDPTCSEELLPSKYSDTCTLRFTSKTGLVFSLSLSLFLFQHGQGIEW